MLPLVSIKGNVLSIIEGRAVNFSSTIMLPPETYLLNSKHSNLGHFLYTADSVSKFISVDNLATWICDYGTKMFYKVELNHDLRHIYFYSERKFLLSFLLADSSGRDERMFTELPVNFTISPLKYDCCKKKI